MKTMAYLHATNDRCVSVSPNSYLNAKELVLRTDAESRLHNFDDRSLNAVLAGLRLLQRTIISGQRLDKSISDIATNYGSRPILSQFDIDDLCERLNVADA